MELIVISNPGAVTDEAHIVNRLFEAGLTRFHLRKPDWKIDQFIELLMGIDQTFHSCIALHQQHYLTSTFGIKRLHYTEHQRMKTDAEKLKYQYQKGYILSTSIHSVAHIPALQYFEYAFFSPVFSSISKPGYHSKLANGFRLDKKAGQPKIIALGGVDEFNLNSVKNMNFDGAALLGAIWNDPEKAVANFIKIKTVADQLNA